MFSDNQIKLSDGRREKTDAKQQQQPGRVCMCVCVFFRSCAMLEPIKKEIKTEEKKRRGETRAHCEQKFFDLSLPFR